MEPDQISASDAAAGTSPVALSAGDCTIMSSAVSLSHKASVRHRAALNPLSER